MHLSLTHRLEMYGIVANRVERLLRDEHNLVKAIRAAWNGDMKTVPDEVPGYPDYNPALLERPLALEQPFSAHVRRWLGIQG